MKLAVFKGRQIRRQWDNKQEKWYFSVIDIVEVLTDSPNPRSYWKVLKFRLKKEGSEVVTKCNQLKLPAPDGKMRPTDTADTETLFRLIQSIPSPKAEPFKRWLAKVGYERVQDISDPERSLNRARAYWQRMGRSQKWIQQRMMGQETRNKLTDYWHKHKVKEPDEYAILTNIIHKEWSDFSVKQHKSYKGLKQQNLRDHMSEAELIFTALAELSTRQIAETVKAKGLIANKLPAHRGGRIAKHARLELEQKTGKTVVTRSNFLGSGEERKRLR
ncbi:antirepressor [Candidatus Beckwithbacteria bacterium RIFCSPHIGHO2_12_FULL_47_17]|uniref:Antirepressor n=1 Tax=Candidatus Beckwithbacteria bacterium RIFCSPHIGHO2_12_FULL_47_17 TaxID=1797460 RepID=A0A1F5DKS6_9BACT|nr:MAG: antirepressor [Candidatus Beckwithbacteria bacterium RIFCSPHIGHO2_12_FULL_47_17]